MSARDAGYKARAAGAGHDANPFADTGKQAWLHKQWSLGWSDHLAEQVESADDARIEVWLDDNGR